MFDADGPIPFDIRLEPHRERLHVVPTGELDLLTAPRLESALLEAFDNGFQHVVADLRELGFIDSSGIRVLWQAHARAERDRVRLSLMTGAGDVWRALRMTGLLDTMHLIER